MSRLTLINYENMKAYVKRGNSKIRPTLKEGGEIVNEIVQEFYVTKHEPGSFIRVFRNHFPRDLNGCDALLLWRVKDFLGYNDPEISLSKREKDKIAADLKLSVSTLDRSIANLRSLDILIRIADQSKKSALYIINPEIMWFGDESARRQMVNSYLMDKHIGNLPEKEKEAILTAKKYEEATIKASKQNVKPIQIIPQTYPMYRFKGVIPAKDTDGMHSLISSLIDKEQIQYLEM
jgi:hypothetical protein